MSSFPSIGIEEYNTQRNYLCMLEWIEYKEWAGKSSKEPVYNKREEDFVHGRVLITTISNAMGSRQVLQLLAELQYNDCYAKLRVNPKVQHRVEKAIENWRKNLSFG